MRKLAEGNVFFIWVFLFLVLASGCQPQTSQVGEVAAQEGSAPTKWEYKVVHFSRDEAEWGSEEPLLPFTEKLNSLGNDGWEYAGVIAADGTNSRFVSFKRKRTPSTD